MLMSSHLKAPFLRGILLTSLILSFFLASYALRSWINTPQSPLPPEPAKHYQRIIALSPSLVEIIYQLGLDEQLVGVSRFCQYPPEASSKPVVGGYLDLDYETVFRLHPDCVLTLEEQAPLIPKLKKAEIHTVTVDHASTQGILDSIQKIGHLFNQDAKAELIIRQMRRRIKLIESQRHTPTPRVLVCLSRDTDSHTPDRIIAAGNKGIHQEFIRIAGGKNAYQGNVAYPRLSREKLILLNPDIIIDLVRQETWESKGTAKLLAQWAAYSELRAVKNNRIIILHDNKHMIPGPRFVDTLEIFSRAIHP